MVGSFLYERRIASLFSAICDLFFQQVEWRSIGSVFNSEARSGGGLEETVGPVPGGIRSLLSGDQVLKFPPFQSSSYSSDIHATNYRCLAKNRAGIISSPAIDLRAGTFTRCSFKSFFFAGIFLLKAGHVVTKT